MSTEEPMIRPCKGDCGRMTRPRHTSQAAGGVETVARIDRKYCSPCYNRFSPALERKREREAQAREKEKAERLAAAHKAAEELAAGRRRRAAQARRRELAAGAVQAQLRMQRRVSA